MLPSARPRPLPLALLVLSALALASASTATAAPRPDLLAKSVSTTASFRTPGQTLTVSDAVRNAGNARAGASQTQFFLSEDSARNAGDVRLQGARSVPGLGSGKSSAGSTSVKVPASTRLDLYRILACADGGTSVRESNEANNCRAADERLLVDAPPPAANPLTVEPDLETANAVNARIDAAGGTLDATGADGTAYTLRVPAGALGSAERITMTPLAAVGGLPMSGGLLGAVDLGPDGLRLGKAATLTIDPPGAGSPDGPDGFAYAGDGRQAHLYSASEGPGKVTMKLLHFSGFGAGEASAGDRATLQERVPVDGEYRQEASLSELLDQLQEGEITPDEWEDQSAHVLIKAFYRQAIPLIDRALSAQGDYFDGEAAIHACVAFERQANLIGLQDFSDPHLGVAIPILVERCNGEAAGIVRKFFNQAYDRCVANVNRPFQLARMTNLAHNAQLIAVDVAEVLGPDYADKIEHCRSLTPPTWSGTVSQTRRIEHCPDEGDGCSGFTEYRIELSLNFEANLFGGFSTGPIDDPGNTWVASYEQDFHGVTNGCNVHVQQEHSDSGSLSPVVPGQNSVRFDYYEEPYAAISGLVDTGDAVGHRTETRSGAGCPNPGTDESTFTRPYMGISKCPPYPREGPPEGTRGLHQVVGANHSIDFACHNEQVIALGEIETIDASGILRKQTP